MMATQTQARERAGQPPPTPEQQATIDKFAQFTPYISIVFIFIGITLFVMIFTAIYWVLFNAILGGTATFRQVLAIVSHSSIIGALGAVIGTPIMYAQGKLSNSGPFNLGALAAGAEPDSFLRHFLGSISIFQIWGILVTAIGLAVLYRRKTGGIATTLLLLYGAVVAAIAYFFGRFMGS